MITIVIISAFNALHLSYRRVKLFIIVSGLFGLRYNADCFNPFSPDGTLKCRFEKFLIFIFKGRGAQIPMGDTTMRR